MAERKVLLEKSPFGAYLRTIGRTLAFAAVLAYLGTWGNEIGTRVATSAYPTAVDMGKCSGSKRRSAGHEPEEIAF